MNQYTEQAETFLQKHGLKLNIRRAVKQTPPAWAKEGKHGIKYNVTISNKRGKHIHFPFWDSIANMEEGKTPSAYSILASVSYEHFDNFNDFCDTFGYSNDSISAEKTFWAVRGLNAKLKSLLSAKALEELNEIQ